MNEYQIGGAGEAYEAIIRPIEARMIRSIWRIVRNRTDAEDAMQDALATVWTRWDRVSRHPNAQALVLKICIDAAYDLRRRRMRCGEGRPKRESLHDPPDRMPVPDALAETAEQSEIVVNVIRQLSRQQATAALMRIVEGLPYSAIASAMGTTESTARKHVARARARLRSAFPEFNSID